MEKICTQAKFCQFFLLSSRGVGPACLPYAYKTFPVANGTSLTAIGWGGTEFALSARADKTSWILQKVTLTHYQNTNTFTCVGNRLCLQGTWNQLELERKDTCQRDSGGGSYGYFNSRQHIMSVTR